MRIFLLYELEKSGYMSLSWEIESMILFNRNAKYFMLILYVIIPDVAEESSPCTFCDWKTYCGFGIALKVVDVSMMDMLYTFFTVQLLLPAVYRLNI
jgi:hypothetical protein